VAALEDQQAADHQILPSRSSTISKRAPSRANPTVAPTPRELRKYHDVERLKTDKLSISKVKAQRS